MCSLVRTYTLVAEGQICPQGYSLVDYLRQGYESDKLSESVSSRMEDARMCLLLLLDDLGSESRSAWTGERVYRLSNHRYDAAYREWRRRAEFHDETRGSGYLESFNGKFRDEHPMCLNIARFRWSCIGVHGSWNRRDFDTNEDLKVYFLGYV